MIAPLFAALQLDGVEPGWAWLWVVLLVVGLVILVAIYWSIFQRSERRLTWALMLLRGAGLLALLLVLAKPSWTGETQSVDAGHVAIVVDNSESMSLADPSGKSRYALATEAVERIRKALDADAGGKRVVVDLFDITGTPLPKNQLPAKPTVPRTDLTLALSEAVAGKSFKRLNGVILISDGMDNTGRQDFKEFAQSYGGPIYTTGFKDDRNTGSFDLALKPVRQPPERVMVNNDLKIDVLVTKTGGPKTNAVVVIKRGLDERFIEKKIAFAEGNGAQTVSLTLKPSQPGLFEFTAVVESDKGEQNLANNSWRFPLRVDSEPIRVLYIEGFLRQEYAFLKRHLESDPDLNVAAIVRRVNPDLNESRDGKDVLTRAQLKSFDVVILGDMEAGYLNPSEYDALVAWLEEKDMARGTEHALLVLGGYRSFGQNGFRKTKLADVLPVVFMDVPPYQSEEPFAIQLTEEGRAHPIFEMASDRVKTEEMWKATTRLRGSALVKKAKPAAQVLAVNPTIRVGGKPAIVAAAQRYGAGHTMVLTADTTWLWSRGPQMVGRPDTLYARFWSQTVRWLAGRGRDEKRALLTVSTDRIAYDVGKQVKVTVVRHSRPEVDLSQAQLSVSYKPAGPGSKPISVPVRNSSATPDIFTGTFFPTAGSRAAADGRFELSAMLTNGKNQVANQGTEFLVHSSSQELLNTGTNTEVLRDLAEASGGTYRDVGKAAELANEIPRKERHTVQNQHIPYWNAPVLFLAFIGFISAEWLIRRRNHLI
jgi:uncharacterized membrane protein